MVHSCSEVHCTCTFFLLSDSILSICFQYTLLVSVKMLHIFLIYLYIFIYTNTN